MQKEKNLRERIKNRPVSTRPTSMKDILFSNWLSLSDLLLRQKGRVGARRRTHLPRKTQDETGREAKGEGERSSGRKSFVIASTPILHIITPALQSRSCYNCAPSTAFHLKLYRHNCVRILIFTTLI
jgi:hypothetical protein